MSDELYGQISDLEYELEAKDKELDETKETSDEMNLASYKKVEGLSKTINKLEVELNKLREWAKHKDFCRTMSFDSRDECTCGLDKLLNKGGE